MKQFFRITAALLAAAFLLALTGCGSSSSAPSFTWFVDTIPANLDPQVASAAPDVIACENLYSGLVRKKADGEIVPDLSESWTISSDSRRWRRGCFLLRSNGFALRAGQRRPRDR